MLLNPAVLVNVHECNRVVHDHSLLHHILDGCDGRPLWSHVLPVHDRVSHHGNEHRDREYEDRNTVASVEHRPHVHGLRGHDRVPHHDLHRWARSYGWGLQCYSQVITNIPICIATSLHQLSTFLFSWSFLLHLSLRLLSADTTTVPNYA